MHVNQAFKSLKEICNSWLLKNEKHPNSMWKIIPLAAEAIQELTLTSLPMVQHALLTKPDGQNWFVLPEDFTAVVSIGIRDGETYRSIGMSNMLMPAGAKNTGGDLNPDEFGNDLGVRGDQVNWADYGTTGRPADFSAADLLDTDFDTEGVVAIGGSAWAGWWRTDTVAINVAQGQIMAHSQFPGSELYLVYVGIGNINTMTHIPLIAQAAIEAYIDWKYIQNKRGGIREGGAFMKLFQRQHKILRARINPLTVTDIKQLRNQQWYPRNSVSSLSLAATNDGSAAVAPTGFDYYTFSYALA